jgi:hypothetical protein
VPWADLAGVRIGAVLWGGLALLDVVTLTPAPSYVAPVAVGVVVAAASARTRTGTALACAVVGWLLVDGFVEHRYGVLGFDPVRDPVILGLFAALSLVSARSSR